MSEIKRFQDDYVLPKDILDRFTKYRKLSKTKEDVFEKFVVEDIQCQGGHTTPVCVYDFTNAIRNVDQLIYRPEVLKSKKREYFYAFDMRRDRSTEVFDIRKLMHDTTIDMTVSNMNQTFSGFVQT